jgi:hypothetical protein
LLSGRRRRGRLLERMDFRAARAFSGSSCCFATPTTSCRCYPLVASQHRQRVVGATLLLLRGWPRQLVRLLERGRLLERMDFRAARAFSGSSCCFATPTTSCRCYPLVASGSSCCLRNTDNQLSVLPSCCFATPSLPCWRGPQTARRL